MAGPGNVEIGVNELEKLMDDRSVQVLDVREDWEWRGGHVPGASHIPLAQLPENVNRLPRDRTIAVICETGSRSLVATHFLLARGFPGTVSVSGGTSAWQRSGRTVERG